MSRSVSAPSSVTKTSPCWNGFIVPGSTFRYGSSFCITTRSPREVRRLPRLAAVRPFPSEETTPPVTKMCFVVLTGSTCSSTTDFDHTGRAAGTASGLVGEVEQLLGMRERGVARRQAGQQARHLGDPVGSGQLLHRRDGDLAVGVLEHAEVVRGERRDL